MSSVMRDEQAMREMVREALFAQRTISKDAEIDDELLAVMASGELDELPPEQRERALRMLVSSPLAGEVVADAWQVLGAKEQALAETEAPEVIGRIEDGVAVRPAKPQRSGTFGWMIGVGWVAAASLMIGLGTWRAYDPPMQPGSDTKINVMNTDDKPDYWAEASQKQQMARMEQDRWRDIALASSTTACALLSIGALALMLTRRRRDNAPTVAA